MKIQGNLHPGLIIASTIDKGVSLIEEGGLERFINFSYNIITPFLLKNGTDN
jgi:hypothetical protein